MKRLRRRRGFTLVEIMIVVAIIALLAAIAIPNVLRGRTTANESAAIGNMRALVSSLEMFRSVNQQYPDTWGAMYTQTPPNPDYGPPAFNDATLSAFNVQGYNYTYVVGASNATYNVTGNVITPGRTGTRAFYVDDSGQIRHCSGAAGATVASKTIDQTPNASCP